MPPSLPPLPPSIPSNLTTILSSIRSKVFLTTHNPTAARLGNKWLRKSLVGPTMMEWYTPKTPKLSTLNHSLRAELEQAKKRYIAKGGDKREVEKWEQNQVAQGYVPVERQINAQGTEGLFWDEREDRRLRKVARRKRIGKGPPKKGQGKRSQMGKR